MSKRRPRRKPTAKFKSQVALAALMSDKSLAKLSKQFKVHANRISAWVSAIWSPSSICPPAKCWRGESNTMDTDFCIETQG